MSADRNTDPLSTNMNETMDSCSCANSIEDIFDNLAAGNRSQMTQGSSMTTVSLPSDLLCTSPEPWDDDMLDTIDDITEPSMSFEFNFDDDHVKSGQQTDTFNSTHDEITQLVSRHFGEDVTKFKMEPMEWNVDNMLDDELVDNVIVLSSGESDRMQSSLVDLTESIGAKLSEPKPMSTTVVPKQSSSPDLFAEYEHDTGDTGIETLSYQMSSQLTLNRVTENDIIPERIHDLQPAEVVSQSIFEPNICVGDNKNTEIICDDNENDADDAKKYDKVSGDRKSQLIKEIEDIYIYLLESLIFKKELKIDVRNRTRWDNVTLSENQTTTLKHREDARMKTICFSRKQGEKNFTVIIHLLADIYKLLITNSSCTKRELYYQATELFGNQLAVNAAVNDICSLLDATPWELGVLSTSKGLIAGAIKISTVNGECIDVGHCIGGTLLPPDVTGIRSIDINAAKLVLIVEKDAIFERLLTQDVCNKFGWNIILVTGKGYPDVNTRAFVKRLHDDFKIPIYILVDCDPYGIEIMLTYRYGSLAMSHSGNALAVPTIRWIGVHPSDIGTFDIPTVPLTAEDSVRLQDLLRRPYISERIFAELETLRNCQCKAEIEGVASFSSNYLLDEYIVNKIRGDFGI